MEIGLVTWSYPPEKSGLSVAAREIAQALAAAGHAVRVLTFDRGGRSHDGAVTIVGCAPVADGWMMRWRRLAAVGHLAGPWAIGRAVAAEHRRRRFDVVEGTNWYAPGLFVALAGAMPYVTRNSTPVATSQGHEVGLRAWIDRGFAKAVEAVAARRSRGLLSNTEPHGRRIANLYRVPPPGPRHHVVGLSLDPEMIACGAAADYPVDAPVRLLFVGRDEPRKGFDALLPAVATLACEAAAGAIPDFRLTIVGVDSGRVAKLPPDAAARVSAHHRLTPDALRAAMAAAHVVAAPSRYESFGLVYQEAMAFGRPIMACAEDPSARLFVGGTGAGLLAPACTPDALATTLRTMIADPALRLDLHRASRAAAGRYTRETLARETLAAYAAMTGVSPG